jgi:hypothetical protein
MQTTDSVATFIDSGNLFMKAVSILSPQALSHATKMEDFESALSTTIASCTDIKKLKEVLVSTSTPTADHIHSICFL